MDIMDARGVKCLDMGHKRGPDPERLIIDQDPEEALAKLLKTPPKSDK